MKMDILRRVAINIQRHLLANRALVNESRSISIIKNMSGESELQCARSADRESKERFAGAKTTRCGWELGCMAIKRLLKRN